MSITFVTRLHKAIKNEDGKHPVVLQITWDRKVRRKRLGLWAFDYQFESTGKGRFRKGIHGREENQEVIDKALSKAESILEDMGDDFVYSKFSKLFDKKSSQKKELKKGVKVAEFSYQVADNFIKNGQVRSGQDYRTLGNIILRVSPKDIAFEEFDEEWLELFEPHFDKEGSNGFNIMNHLKILYGKAVQKRVADFTKNPFKNPYTNPYGFDISKFKKRRVSKTNKNKLRELTLDQLKKFVSYKPKRDRERLYLDIWLFSYYTFGTNLTDIAHVEKKDIKDGRWHYKRSKTGVGLKGGKPLLPEALEIIERMKKWNKGSKYIFPILTEGLTPEEQALKVNNFSGYIRKLCKVISEEQGIEGYATYYSARYTSTTLALNMGADRNTVSHLLDHKNFSTLDHYAGRADDKKVVEAMELLRL